MDRQQDSVIDPSWIQEADIGRLPLIYQELIDIIGIESTIRLARHMGGLGVYFPKIDKIVQCVRDRKIREEFNGANYADLARRYNLTERWVREIIEQGRTEDQAALFE